MSQPQNENPPSGLKPSKGRAKKFLTASVLGRATDDPTPESAEVATPEPAQVQVVKAVEPEPVVEVAAEVATEPAVVPAEVTPTPGTSRRGSARATGSDRALSVATDESTVGAAARVEGLRYTRADTAGSTTRLGTTVDQGLSDELRKAVRAWEAANPDLSRQLHPNEGSFREALLRMGLKYINDPEFASLIRPDRRFSAR